MSFLLPKAYWKRKCWERVL